MIVFIDSSGGATDPDAIAIRAKLTAWWEMSEASGARNDAKGTSHLSVDGTVTTATGVRGGADVAASFAGAGGLFVTDNTAISVPSGGGNHCIFGWAYISSSSPRQFLVAKWNQVGAASLEYSIQTADDGKIYGASGASAYYYTPGSGVTTITGSWVFYVQWRDSTDGKLRLQINDGTIHTSSLATDPNDTGSSLGFGYIPTGAFKLTGRMQRWGFARGAILTSGERTWLYNSGAGRTWAEILALS